MVRAHTLNLPCATPSRSPPSPRPHTQLMTWAARKQGQLPLSHSVSAQALAPSQSLSAGRSRGPFPTLPPNPGGHLRPPGPASQGFSPCTCRDSGFLGARHSQVSPPSVPTSGAPCRSGRIPLSIWAGSRGTFCPSRKDWGQGQKQEGVNAASDPRLRETSFCRTVSGASRPSRMQQTSVVPRLALPQLRGCAGRAARHPVGSSQRLAEAGSPPVTTLQLGEGRRPANVRRQADQGQGPSGVFSLQTLCPLH